MLVIFGKFFDCRCMIAILFVIIKYSLDVAVFERDFWVMQTMGSGPDNRQHEFA